VELNAYKIPDGTVLEADVCIIGAGPAGLALAHEFVGHKAKIVMLESGGLTPEDPVQELNEGMVVGGSYAGLRQTRYRAVGGSVWQWNTPVAGDAGAKYAPLDSCDLEERAELGRGSWPFDYSHLETFYRRAQVFCGLGPFTYDGEAWSDEKHLCFELNGNHLTSRVYQFAIGRLYTHLYPDKIRRSANICLCYHATVCGLEIKGGNKRVAGAKFTCLAGGEFRVKASLFVLAAGTIENTRLLLLSGGGGTDALGNRHGWLGRCFMEHPRDHALTLIPDSPELFEKATFYDAHTGKDGTIIGGRLALREDAIRAAKLPNASITLLPRLKLPVDVGARLLSRLRCFIGRQPDGGYGWSRFRHPSKFFDAFQLLVNLEQRPSPENRVVLGRKRDSLGLPQVELHWDWRAHEQAELERLHTVMAAEIEAAGLGRVEINGGHQPDPNARHHAGTTRMHADPRLGVVDADSRVHGTENLYVVGGSVLFSAGFANPTLTIVAMALRLADHLKQRT
jgi:choline dehydrogenase-like flavoprotein